MLLEHLQQHHFGAIERSIQSLEAEASRLMSAGDYSCEFPAGDAKALREVLEAISNQMQPIQTVFSDGFESGSVTSNGSMWETATGNNKQLSILLKNQTE